MTKAPDRAGLRRVPLSDVPIIGGSSTEAHVIVITISVGQPMSALHRAGYDIGGYILELDADEHPVCAYRRELADIQPEPDTVQ